MAVPPLQPAGNGLVHENTTQTGVQVKIETLRPRDAKAIRAAGFAFVRFGVWIDRLNDAAYPNRVAEAFHTVANAGLPVLVTVRSTQSLIGSGTPATGESGSAATSVTLTLDTGSGPHLNEARILDSRTKSFQPIPMQFSPNVQPSFRSALASVDSRVQDTSGAASSPPYGLPRSAFVALRRIPGALPGLPAAHAIPFSPSANLTPAAAHLACVSHEGVLAIVMQKSQHRFVELDFFRGLVLLVIVIDHIGGSILSRFTLHAYALCDAAEVFVFLGGFATATAYAALAQRRTDAIARNRFLKRSFEIYRAFLVTAGLMLLVSAVMVAFSVDAPNLATSDLDNLIDAPLTSLGEILLFRRQPYLASVLPMYAFFALMVPVVLPLARSKPWLLLAGSVALWAGAPHLAGWLPGAGDTPWDFNPLAWQLMFVLGVIARCQPVYQRVAARRGGWIVTLLAAGGVGAAAYYKLALATAPLDPGFKQNLMGLRALNFLAIAWLVADLVRFGWAGRIAHRLPWISLIGRKGLVCFVAGTVISLVVDSLLYQATDGLLDVPRGLAADAIAVGSLLLVAWAAEPVSRFIASCLSRQPERARSIADIAHAAGPTHTASAPSRSTAPSARSSTPGR